MALGSCLSGVVGICRRLGAALPIAIIALCAVGAAFADEAPVYYSGGQAVPLQRVPDQVTIELAPVADRNAIAYDLATRGMPTMIAPSPGAMLLGIRLIPIQPARGQTVADVRGVPGISQAHPLYRDARSGRLMVTTDRVVVRFKAGTGDAGAEACLSQYGLAKVQAVLGLSDTYVVRTIDPQADVVPVAASLYKDPRVAFAHPDFFVELEKHQATTAITDTYYTRQWHLNNTGQNGARVDADIDWPEAWSEVAGLPNMSLVRIAINDDSVEKDHEDLKDAFLVGRDAYYGGTDPTPKLSQENHGTCVAGLALARLNGKGVVGVAPTARMIAIRLGEFLPTSAIAEGFSFALLQNADVINNSWGGGLMQDVITNAINQAHSAGRGGKGMVVVFSAGNTPDLIQNESPVAGLPSVIAVGASNSFDREAVYSAYGPELCVMAPSLDFVPGALGITTTDVMDDPNLGLPTQGYNPGTGTDIYGRPDLPNGSYTQNFGGTSASAPIVTGVVGLIVGTSPALTAEQVRRILEHTADQIDLAGGSYDPVTGHSLFYGYGRVNAFQAVKAAKLANASGGLTWPPPVSNLYMTGTSTVKMTWVNPTEEATTVMVVHGLNSPITWTPAGMRTETPKDYSVNEYVAPGVQVVEVASVGSADSQSYTADPGQGIHYYALFVQNAAKRWSWGRSAVASLGPKTAPKASISVTPRTGLGPLTVSFTGGAVDLDREDITFAYNWDFGDLQTATGQTASHTYTTPGTYLAKLTVTEIRDTGGGLQGTATAIIRVTQASAQPPTVRIGADPSGGTGPAPLTVVFSFIGDPSQIGQYTWDFGDGTGAAARQVEHTYINPGTYAVTLEVVDKNGISARASKLISVWAPADPNQTGGTSKPSTGQSLLPCTIPGLGMLLAMTMGWGLLRVGRRRD